LIGAFQQLVRLPHLDDPGRSPPQDERLQAAAADGGQWRERARGSRNAGMGA